MASLTPQQAQRLYASCLTAVIGGGATLSAGIGPINSYGGIFLFEPVTYGEGGAVNFGEPILVWWPTSPLPHPRPL